MTTGRFRGELSSADRPRQILPPRWRNPRDTCVRNPPAIGFFNPIAQASLGPLLLIYQVTTRGAVRQVRTVSRRRRGASAAPGESGASTRL